MKNPISKEVVGKIKNLLVSEKQIICAYIFGSQVKGKETKSSDLDIAAVCFEKKNVDIRKLMRKFQEIFPEVETDFSLVDIENDPLFLMQIINGKVIYEKTLNQRTKLETAILHKFEDSEHLRRIDDNYLNKSFEEGIYAH